jgi:sugar phosphate isomerase/epimerase
MIATVSDLYVATTTLDLPPAEGLLALASEGWRHVCVEGDATQMHQIARQRPLPAAHLVTPWLNLASDDRSRYERSLAEAREAIRILGDTGASWLAVSPGFAVYGGLDLDGQTDSEPADRLKARLRLLRALDRLANDADNHRMQLILRQQPALGREELLVDADDGDRLLQSLGAPHVALGLDLGHAKITARRLRRDPDEVVESMLANARMVWLHGNEGRDDGHARPKLDSWEMSQLDRPAIRSLPLVYDAWRQPATDLRAVVSHLCEQGGRSV